MNRLAWGLGILALLLAGTSLAPAATIIFDENGHGFMDSTNLGSGMGKEPISGVTTLFYTLTFAVGAGDVGVVDDIDPVTGKQIFGDLLRFSRENVNTVFRVYVFSLMDANEPNEPGVMADVA